MLIARAAAPTAGCPDCGTVSSSLHGSYLRSLRDAPRAGVPVPIRLQVRRFRCCAERCGRRTFVEQIPDLTSPHARYSPPLFSDPAAIRRAGTRRAGCHRQRGDVAVGWADPQSHEMRPHRRGRVAARPALAVADGGERASAQARCRGGRFVVMDARVTVEDVRSWAELDALDAPTMTEPAARRRPTAWRAPRSVRAGPRGSPGRGRPSRRSPVWPGRHRRSPTRAPPSATPG